MSPSAPSEGRGGSQRRFIGRVRIFNEQRQRESAEAGHPLVPDEQLAVLEDYLDISRRRNLTRIPMFKLQMHMLQDLVVAEKGIGEYRKMAKALTGDDERDEEDEAARAEAQAVRAQAQADAERQG